MARRAARQDNKTLPRRAGSALTAEIARFDALAAQWWDEAGPMRPLHRINPARLTFIRDMLIRQFGQDRKKAPLQGLRLLDCGCGAGILSEPLARMGAHVAGIDAAPAAIRAAQAHAAAGGITIDYRCATAETLVAEGAQFDAVCALEIIEHVADPAVFIADLARLVRPGGLLLLSTLNRTAKSFLLGIVAAEYLLGWVPRGTHDWRKFVPPADLARMLRAAGLEVSALSGLVYDPLQRDFILQPGDVAVNYLLAAKKPAKM